MEKLKALHVEVEDESALHAGHAGARESGGGHFRVVVVSELFAGLATLARHRLVYETVWGAAGMPPVHALALKTWTPAEWSARQGEE